MHVIHAVPGRIVAHHVTVGAVVIFNDFTPLFERPLFGQACKVNALVPGANGWNIFLGETSSVAVLVKGFGKGAFDDARVDILKQGGIAPSPTILFPSPDPDCEGDECKEPELLCVGVECFDPGFENNPVRTLWTQDGIE